jgi:flagellar biosynthetic protein FlhB
VVENKELARNLYKAIEVGETIGTEFYKGIAELLAYVYKLKGKTAG